MKHKSRKIISLLASLSILLISSNSSASERSAEDLKRDKSSKPQQVIELMAVKKGDSILDLFGGGGYYSELLSAAVGREGNIVLHNNNAYLKYVGKALEKRLAENRLENVTSVIKEAKDLQLQPAKFDKVFYVLGYHDLSFKSDEWQVTSQQVIPQIYRALKPKGKILVIDHNATKGSGASAAQQLHRIEADFVIQDMKKYGFELVKSSDLLANNSDKLSESVFKPELRRKTSRFVLIFEKQ